MKTYPWIDRLVDWLEALRKDAEAHGQTIVTHEEMHVLNWLLQIEARRADPKDH